MAPRRANGQQELDSVGGDFSRNPGADRAATKRLTQKTVEQEIRWRRRSRVSAGPKSREWRSNGRNDMADRFLRKYTWRRRRDRRIDWRREASAGIDHSAVAAGQHRHLDAR